MNDTGYNRMLRALEAEEDNLTRVHEALLQAQLELILAARKYAATRDVFIERVGTPYPPEALAEGRGRYRFVGLELRDTLYEALDEMDKPVSLRELQEALREGGYDLDIVLPPPVTADLRSLNAALINLHGIKTTGKGPDKKFFCEPSEELQHYQAADRKRWIAAKRGRRGYRASSKKRKAATQTGGGN